MDKLLTPVYVLLIKQSKFNDWTHEAMRIWSDITGCSEVVWYASEAWQTLSPEVEQELALASILLCDDSQEQIPLDDGRLALSLSVAGWLIMKGVSETLNDEQLSIWRLLSSQWVLRGRTVLAEREAAMESWLLSSVSHDLRAPLNSILNFLELMDTPGVAVNRQLPTVKNEADRLLRLITQLLDFSRLQAKRLSLRPTSVNLLEWVGQAMMGWRDVALEKQIELSVHLANPLPLAIELDAERLMQVIQNLISNSVKFTQNGYVQLSVSADLETKRLFFEVKDTGVGIESARQAYIFDSFVQARSEDHLTKNGVGLGLNIVKQLVELMHGSIVISSALGEGTSIKLEVPYEEAEDPLEQDYHDTLSNETILVIEDNRKRADTLVQYLRYFGAHTVIANSGPEAHFYLRQSNTVPDWIFIQSALKGVDAHSTLSKIAEQLELSELELNERVVWLIESPFDARSDCRSLKTPLSLPELYQTLMFRSDVDVESEEMVKPVVLIVDDTELNLQLTDIQLTKLGVDVITASSGLEALDILEHKSADLIFMDIMMPSMDGYETTQRIRAKGNANGLSGIPIVALTASALSQQQQKYLAAGMNDYLAKPYRIEELHAVIRKYLPSFHFSSIKENTPTFSSEDVMDEGALVSWEQALVMVGGDESILLSILAPFIDDLPSTIDNLSDAIDKSDWEALQRKAHSLKSMLRTFGALPLGNATFELEKAAKSDERGRIEVVWKEFLALYPATLRHLRARLNG
ncbi:response regulator [Salinispirillum sp. LH 10-3-1]|uniref:histidine kinase n=1 Tax=Salinispirillum sp. LH 10-3-1 TaxID=2952525 RepID=A0AB38YI45_9GAMM